MKHGRPARAIAAASFAALGVLPVFPSAASAAPSAPASYTAVARAYPMHWSGSNSGLAVGGLRVPYVSGLSNHLAVAQASATLANPDLSVSTMSGDSISGLECIGFERERCADPFLPEATATHAGKEPAAVNLSAAFTGKDGKAPGSIRALETCPNDCGRNMVRTFADATAPPGSLAGLISVGSSTATQDIYSDDSGRLVSVAKSELRNVAIGPHAEVRFSSMTTTASAGGTGAEGTKDGRVDVKVSDFVILDNPVELTRSGLRLANGAPSEQEAYDGAYALLAQLKQQRGITLEFANLGEIQRQPNHVTVQVQAMKVTFDRSVQAKGVSAGTVEQIFDLGSATVLVAAFDTDRRIDVSFEGDDVVVQAAEPAAATPAAQPAPPNSPAVPPTASSVTTAKPNATASRLPANGHVSIRTSNGSAPAPASPAPAPAPTQAVPAPVAPEPASPGPAQDTPDSVVPAPTPAGPNEVALSPADLANTLKGARTVTRAFGAFLCLGLVLPLARFVIRRFG